MSSFAAYSAYYDLLYRDKDYAAEAEYVSNILKSTAGFNVSSILELGCGTGKHAELLTSAGFAVTGVDLSPTMIDQARTRLKNAKSARFQQGDVRTIRLEEYYDAVISLFHVASYQVTNEDVVQYLRTAASHLKQGGIFLFDFWYGPAVHKQQPTVRIKRMEDSAYSIVRLAEPVHRVNECLVEVNFEVYVTSKKDQQLEVIRELHQMRYFFLPELSMLLEQAGFESASVRYEEWLSREKPSESTWGVTAVAKKA